MTVPCNGCVGCRIARSKEWATRCLHEASLHQDNCFITLTYSPEHLPHDEGLRKEDFQKFMKRLRKNCRTKVRYYMAGEYGNGPEGGLGRPHYHAIIFGFDFPDKYIWNENSKLYRSETLEKLWPMGHSSIGNVSYQSAKYVAQYVMKKINGNLAETHYRKTDTETGEYYEVEPEYNAMSLKPGIAYDWYQRYSADIFPGDFVIIDGQKQPTPRYYLKMLEKNDPSMFKWIKQKRRETAKRHQADNQPERLEVREKLTQSNLNRNERKLA